MYDISHKCDFMKKARGKEICLKHYGSATVGERGQVVLPAEARKQFKIEAGEKLLVLGSEAGGFQKIVLMRSEAITGLLNHLLDVEERIKESKPKDVEKMLKEGLEKTRNFKRELKKVKK